MSIVVLSQAAMSAAQGFDPLLVFFGAGALASLLLIVLLVRDGDDSLPDERTPPKSDPEVHATEPRDVGAGR
jgi:hypothetical protein